MTDLMQRRTFIKQSAVGIGTLAGVHSGILKMDPAADAQEPSSPAHLNQSGAGGSGLPEWGTNAAVLKTPWSRPPFAEALLNDQEHTVVLSHFYRVGGSNLSATPTECRISHSEEELFVTVHCEERNLGFPYAHLDEAGWPNADWYSLQGLPSGSRPICPPYPDEVDLLLQPDAGIPVYYQFAATLQGLKFGCKREIALDSNAAPDDAAITRRSPVVSKKIDGFEAVVSTQANAWIVVFTIPWATVGARPRSHFGLLPMRTRWRNGEFSSPVALDFNEGLPIDLLIEIHTPGAVEVANLRSGLCQLPSGIFRWQRPLVAMDPDIEVRRQIWEMQSSLSTPTSQNNLAQRLYLTQCWMDLLMQEGFTPVPGMWGILKQDLSSTPLRQRVNAAFQKRDMEAACRLLDRYLGDLDAMSRWWYADGSPGNIRDGEWLPVAEIEDIEVHGKLLHMRCLAGSRQISLTLSLPATGGIRIHGEQEGYWKPDNLLPLSLTRGSGSYSVKAGDTKVVIHQKPMAIVFYDGAGREVTQIGRKGLAFRFDSDGKILASDFRGRLDSNEVIYGFGEKYDHFNENGNVLTLWGTDNWVGNGLGRANTTYKPLPIFHSSKSYMVFINSPYRLLADVGKTLSGRYRLTQHGPIVDYYFWLGEPEEALRSYTALTGRVPVPPRWAFEPWMGRGGEAWASGPLHDAVAEEESVTRRFAALDIPHSAIYAEGPSAVSPDLQQFMKARGIKVLGYFMPAIGESRQKELLPELKPSDLPVLHCESEAETRALRYIDFSQPNAMELCRRALRTALNLGEAGSMVDYGDLVPDDAVFFDDTHGAYMHNFYYYDYQRTVSEVFRQKLGRRQCEKVPL
jgi:hypothetical protein